MWSGHKIHLSCYTNYSSGCCIHFPPKLLYLITFHFMILLYAHLAALKVLLFHFTSFFFASSHPHPEVFPHLVFSSFRLGYIKYHSAIDEPLINGSPDSLPSRTQHSPHPDQIHQLKAFDSLPLQPI